MTVNGVPYSLFVYVPSGKSLEKVEANSKILYHKQTGNVAKIVMQGQEKPVQWKLSFAR